MRKAIGALVVILLAILVAWLLRANSDRGDGTAASPPVSDRAAPARGRLSARAAGGGPSHGGAEPDAAQADAAAAGRGAPAEPPVFDPLTPAAVALTVVDGDDGKPVRGVTVVYASMGPDLPPAARKALNETAEPFPVLREYGRSLTTDALGRVLIPEPGGRVLVAASDGVRTDSCWITSSTKTARLSLHRAVSVTAIVVDASGAVVADVRVLLTEERSYGRVTTEWRTTGPEGQVRFANIATSEIPADAVLGLSVALPFAPAPYERLDRSAPPSSPVRLVLPPSGSLRVELVGSNGAPVTDVDSILLRLPPAPRGGISFRSNAADARARVVAGVAEFPHVGLGAEFEVEVPADDTGRAARKHRVRGPVRSGETAVARLTIPSDPPILTGRIVDGAGTPIRGMDLLGYVIEPGHTATDAWHEDGTARCVTDSDGRFRFTLVRDPGASPAAKLHVGRISNGPSGSWGGRSVALVDLPASLPGGESDLGSVTFRGTETLVEGTVVDESGNGIQGVRIQAMRPQRDIARRPGRPLDDKVQWGMRAPERAVDCVVTDADGRFRLCGDPATGRVEVGAEADGWFVPEPSDFDAGTGGARIVMHRAGGIAGSVKLPAGAETHRLDVLVQGDPQINGDIQHRFGTDGLSLTVRSDGSFETRTLRPGKARVVLKAGWGRAAQVIRIDDVVVKAGEITRDPRLQNMDPAGDRKRFTVSVADAAGRPVTGAQVSSRPATGGADWESATTEAGGHVLVATPALPAEIVVTCPGHRPVRIESADSDVSVVLADAVASVVRVRLADAATLPAPPHSLGAGLRWLGASAGSGSPARHHPLDVDLPWTRFDGGRVVSFEVWSPGRYEVVLTLWTAHSDGGGSGGPLATSPASIVVTVPPAGGDVDVEVSPDLDALRRQTAGDR